MAPKPNFEKDTYMNFLLRLLHGEFGAIFGAVFLLLNRAPDLWLKLDSYQKKAKRKSLYG